MIRGGIKWLGNNRNSIGRFVQGSSGNPNGRPVGSRNKFTTLKSAFIEAFEELGGVDNLIEWDGYFFTNDWVEAGEVKSDGVTVIVSEVDSTFVITKGFGVSG